MAELDRTKLVNAGNLQDVAQGIYRKSIDEIEGHKGAKTSHEATQVNFTTNITTVTPLGGIPAGTNLNNMSIQEVLTKLLFPHVDHSVSGVQSAPNGGIFEKGTTQTVTQIKGTVTKMSNPIIKVEVLDGTRVIATKEGVEVEAGGTFTFNVSEKVTINKNFQFAAYANGSNGQLLKKSANTGSFNFVYPYYYGVIDADASLTGELIAGLTKKVEAKGNKTYSFTTNKQRMVFAYPKSHGTLKSIKDANSFENIESFTLQTISITGLDGTAQDYYVYVGGISSVSEFKFTFSY